MAHPKPAKDTQPQVDLRHPPPRPVLWTAWGGGKRVTVVHQVWFEARREAMALLGVGPDQITVEQA